MTIKSIINELNVNNMTKITLINNYKWLNRNRRRYGSHTISTDILSEQIYGMILILNTSEIISEEEMDKLDKLRKISELGSGKVKEWKLF